MVLNFLNLYLVVNFISKLVKKNYYFVCLIGVQYSLML